ncbi:MAG: oxidoreductase [Sphingobacteriales bacterium]|nr:MAG: oxidoreductase [Sphingobacteriales bacterium]
MSKTALLVGATGLVGSEVLNILLNDNSFTNVTVLCRKPLSQKYQKLKEIIVDFDNLGKYKNDIVADVVFCCLGTTIKKAGSQAAFKKVDFEYPLEVAKIAKANGAVSYNVITALGSDAHSSIFYNRVKGELQNELMKLNFNSLHIIQPSLLIGERNETRIGEGIAQKLSPIMNSLLIGKLKKYKAIEGTQVAKAMVHYSKENSVGTFIHSNETLFV